MYIFLASIIVILLIIILNFKDNKKKYYKLKRNIEFAISLPGAPIPSSIVNSLKVACNYKDVIYYLEAITKKYGGLTSVILGTNVFVILARPEDYKLVLTNVNGNNKSSVTKGWKIFIGDGIIRASGTAHRLRRKIIQPFLNIKYLSEYVTFFDNYSNQCADILEKNVDGPMFDLKPHIAQYATNIFLATTMGIRGTAHKGEYDELLYWQQKMLTETSNQMLKPWLQLKWIHSLTKNGRQIYTAEKIFLDFIHSIRKRMKIALETNNEIFEKPKSIFNNYSNRLKQCDDVSCGVSDENFTDDIKSFYFAIQNTIMELTSFLMLMLGIHTEVQEKLRQEISLTFDNDKVDAQRLIGMQYLHMVIQETLRLFPIAPTILRQLTGDIKLDSCTLPDGCCIMIPVFAIHRNPAYWPKPLKFIPERFSPENSSSRYRYTFIPFGTGPRDCLGQRYTFLSVATMIVNLVRRYRFVTTTSMDDIKLTTDIILRSTDVKLSISYA